MTLRLYDYILSGNCYKVRLLLSFLAVEYDAVPVDFYPGKEHKSQAFLKINPAGTIPVLTHGDLVLTETSAILVYIADKFDQSGRFFPKQPSALLGEVMNWLSFSNAITKTAGAARVHEMLDIKTDLQAAQTGAYQALRLLEERLSEQEFDGSPFLVGEHLTIADIACFPYVALAPDGGVMLDDYPAINRWMVTLRKLDRFIEMPGIHPIHESPDKPLPSVQKELERADDE
ncbi:MAG: glutathione S-transferase family protein [Hyphomicrobiales bacterium]